MVGSSCEERANNKRMVTTCPLCRTSSTITMLMALPLMWIGLTLLRFSHYMPTSWICVLGAPFLAKSTVFAMHHLDKLENLDLRLAAALELIGSNEAAGEGALRTIAEENPSYASGHFYLGLVSQARGQHIDAVGFFADTLRADPQHADATNNIATALMALAPAQRVEIAATLGLMPSTLAKELGATIDGHVLDHYVRESEEVIELLYRRTLKIDPSHRWGLNNLGLHLHARDRNGEAAAIFSHAVAQHPYDSELYFHLGISLQSLGKAQEAARSFMAAVEHNPQHVGAALNLAALHHKYGEPSDAVDHYRRAAQIIEPGNQDLSIMLRNNLGTALFQLGEYAGARMEHQTVLDMIESGEGGLPPVDGEGYDVYVDTLVNLHRVRRASCDWRGWEEFLHKLKIQVDTRQLKHGHAPSVLPFDTLLLPYPINATWRRAIAETHSERYMSTITITKETFRFDGPSEKCGKDGKTVDSSAEFEEAKKSADAKFPGEQTKRSNSGMERVLEIGFIGHDFDEHPTAHMMEGIFLWQKRLGGVSTGRTIHEQPSAIHSNSGEDEVMTAAGTGYAPHGAPADCCRYSVYSYGGGHGANGNPSSRNRSSSRTRESIRSLVPTFVDLYIMGHEDAAARIQEEGVDILVDLQGHTLGGRSEIVAARPAPIQVSYLVFPGTSGAPYMDFLLADRHVTPPEHAHHYSESLVLLPRTYQANLYEDRATFKTVATPPLSSEDRTALRVAHGLPEDLSHPVVANFNKLDKLDPESFLLWMQILRRVPGCVLWLLDPDAVESERDSVHERLGDEAEAYGVERSRVVWALRVPKSEHRLRHAAADLFLDTLTYGAHSTATDALAGGLPMVTLSGATFASRVGVSLLRNAGPSQRALIVSSQREYEDLAVELISTSPGRRALGWLRERLREFRTSGPPIVEDDLGYVGTRGGYRKAPVASLFDTRTTTQDINRAFMLMWDVHNNELDRETEPGGRVDNYAGRRFPHIIIAGRKDIVEEKASRMSPVGVLTAGPGIKRKSDTASSRQQRKT